MEAERRRNVWEGQGTEDLIFSSANGSRSSRTSAQTVSGGVAAVKTVVLSSSRREIGSTRLSTMMRNVQVTFSLFVEDNTGIKRNTTMSLNLVPSISCVVFSKSRCLA